jgi:4a-hydroxytetrahydrobiopterin dehydratase
VTGDSGDDRTVLWGSDLEGEHLEDWRILYATLTARFATGDFATGLELVAAIGAAAEEVDHHPDVDLAYPRVDVRLTSHDVGGVTARDVRLARRISELAAELGATAQPGSVSAFELALDTPDDAAIKPFWAALLGYEISDDPDDQITDPDGKRPTIWFQRSEPGKGEAVPSQRWHLDLRVPPEIAEDRIQACLDAGGTLVWDGGAPAFWVLADPQGNRACVCTWQGRDAG